MSEFPRPSECFETQGLVVAEAMARGLPVVVSSGIAAAEAVHDGVDGIVFKRGDCASLKTALGRLADDCLVREMGVSAHRRYWREPQTISRHCDELEVVYRSVLSRQGHR